MAITVKSGFWNDTYSFVSGKAPSNKQLKRLMRQRGMGITQKLFTTLDGVAPGSTATKQYSRVTSNGTSVGVVTSLGSLGGLRGKETQTQINRATLAADVTYLNNLVTKRFAPTSYPGDRSGNGK